MNNNPNEAYELECQLRAKAALQLQEEIIKDLECEDKSLAELLKKDKDEDKTPKNDTGSGN